MLDRISLTGNNHVFFSMWEQEHQESRFIAFRANRRRSALRRTL
jgi:hypothetical protein